MTENEIEYKNYQRLVTSAAVLKKAAKDTCDEDISFEKALLCVSLDQHIGEYITLLSDDLMQAMCDMTDQIKDVASEIYHCCT